MIAPTPRPLHAALDAEEQALADRMHALGDSEPSAAMDTRIRTQARVALRKQPLAVWGAGLAAVLALGIGIRVMLAPTELAVPTSPAPPYAPTERAAARAQAAPAEGAGASSEAKRTEAQSQPADSSPMVTTSGAPPSSPPLPAAEPASATSSESNRERADDTTLSADSEDGNKAVLDQPVAELESPIPTVSDPASAEASAAEPLRQAEIFDADFRTRPGAVVTPLTPVSVPASPAAAAGPTPAPNAPLPNAFPSIDTREQPAPVDISAPRAEEKPAKSDQGGATFSRDDALNGADAQPSAAQTTDSGQKARTGAPMPRLQPTRTPAAAAQKAVEADTEATLDRAATSQGVTGEPSLVDLMARARRAHEMGDAAGLRTTLLRINRLYSGAQLPADMQAWLNREVAR